MKKNLLKIMSVVALSMLLFGCGAKAPAEEGAKETAPPVATESGDYYPVTITTYNYAKAPIELTFDKAPEKVVAIYQSGIETMLALGLEDHIAMAVMLDDPVKPEYEAAFAKIKYQENRPTKEEVLAMEPDFILSWYSLFGEKNYGDVGFWNERGINTYIWQNSGLISPNTLDNEYQDILNIGKIFNVQDKAQAIVDQMKSEIQSARESVKDKEKVRAIIVEVEKDGQYRVYGEKTIGGDIASQVGAELLAKDAKTIGKEELIDLNPDVIFSVYYGDSIIKDQAQTAITEDDSLKSISAVQNNRVHPIVLSEVYASGIRTYDGIQTIIKGLYP